MECRLNVSTLLEILEEWNKWEEECEEYEEVSTLLEILGYKAWVGSWLVCGITVSTLLEILVAGGAGGAS